MSELQCVKFGDLAQQITTKVNPKDTSLNTYVGLEHLDSGSLQIKRRGTPQDVIGEKLQVCKGDIIFGKRRVYQRKLAIADFDGICSAHAMVLRPKEEVVDKNFFPFFMQSDLFMERALQISVGSLSPTINWKTLVVQEFTIPSLSDQHRIATTLWAAEDCIVKGERFLAAAERAKQVLMGELFSKGIGHTEFKDVKGFRKIPIGWNLLTIHEICDIFDSHRVPIKEADRAKRCGPFPYYGAQGIIDWIDDFIFDGNFLLIAEDGENLNSKVLPIAYQVSGKFWVNNHAHVLKPKKENEIGFIKNIFNFINIDGFIVGSAQPKLTQSDLMKIILPLPSLSEQRQIAGILTHCDETNAAACANVTAAKALKMKMINEMQGGENSLKKVGDYSGAPIR